MTEMVVFGATPIYHLYDKGRLLAASLRLWRLPGQARAQPGFCHMAPRSGQPLMFGIWYKTMVLETHLLCHMSYMSHESYGTALRSTFRQNHHQVEQDI